MSTIIQPSVLFINDTLAGDNIDYQVRRIKDLKGIFANTQAYEQFNPEHLAYEVQCSFSVKEGTSGGLFFGITKIHPGKVGNEYFMTKGHFHSKSETSEYYWGIKGEGMLILMDRNRKCWAERMFPGSLHFIPGHVAHRVANVGNEVLSFGACWPSDAGHNYEEIAKNGFSARLVCENNKAVLVDEPNK